MNIFYKRGEYYWIGNDMSETSNPKWFGDVPRGMHMYYNPVLFLNLIRSKLYLILALI